MIKKIFLGLGVFAVAMNGWLLVRNYVQEQEIRDHAAAAPIARETGYLLHKDAIERAKGFTVLISNEGFGSVGRGTGVLIDKVHVLTCAHLVESWEDDLWVFTNDGGFLKARPAVMSRKLDLAVLDLSRPVIDRAIAKFEPQVQPGQPITIIGNILGSMQWFVSYGIVSGTYKIWHLTDGLIRGGNSGGPWINEDGDVVAISAWGLVDRKGEVGVSGGISAGTVSQFLSDWKGVPYEGKVAKNDLKWRPK